MLRTQCDQTKASIFELVPLSRAVLHMDKKKCSARQIICLTQPGVGLAIREGFVDEMMLSLNLKMCVRCGQAEKGRGFVLGTEVARRSLAFTA
jgi:hypothetical protein